MKSTAGLIQKRLLKHGNWHIPCAAMLIFSNAIYCNETKPEGIVSFRFVQRGLAPINVIGHQLSGVNVPVCYAVFAHKRLTTKVVCKICKFVAACSDDFWRSGVWTLTIICTCNLTPKTIRASDIGAIISGWQKLGKVGVFIDFPHTLTCFGDPWREASLFDVKFVDLNNFWVMQKRVGNKPT